MVYIFYNITIQIYSLHSQLIFYIYYPSQLHIFYIHNLQYLQHLYFNKQIKISQLKYITPYTHMQTITNQINNQRVKNAFQSLGYSQRDYINFQDLHTVMNKLNNQQFNHDIFQQLWQQCKLNTKGQTKLYNFIDNLIRAQAILIQKQRQTSETIKKVQKKLKSASISNSAKIDLNQEYNQLVQLGAGFALDLETIRKPFTKYMMETVIPSSVVQSRLENFGIQNRAKNVVKTISTIIANRKSLVWIFYLNCIGLFFSIIIYLYLNAFMNSVLFLLIFSLYFFQHFDRKVIRFIFFFTCFTLLIDFMWYIIQAKNVWYSHQIGMWPQFLNGYLKMSVILIACVSVIKILIAILLFSQYDIDEKQPQQIQIYGKTFILKSDNQNAPLKRIINQFDNKPNSYQIKISEPFSEIV